MHLVHAYVELDRGWRERERARASTFYNATRSNLPVHFVDRDSRFRA